MKRLLLLLCCISNVGCDVAENETAVKPASNRSAAPRVAKAEASSPTNPAPEPVAYSDVASALDGLSKAVAADNQEAIRATTVWLAKQNAEAVEPIRGIVLDSDQELRFRLACLNILGYMGPSAEASVLEATRSETPHIRRKAADTLGSIHPSSSEIVTRLIELVDDEDAGLRRSAVESLGRIGKPAQRAAPTLQAILNSDADDSLRGAAKTALKKVDPRVRFGDY